MLIHLVSGKPFLACLLRSFYDVKMCLSKLLHSESVGLKNRRFFMLANGDAGIFE
jgi:hypothetical protein